MTRAAAKRRRSGAPRGARPVAVVTGAGGGLGRAITRALLAAGLHVAATDLGGAKLRLPAAGRRSSPSGRFLALDMDVTSPESIACASGLILEQLGGVSVLVNNAGVFAQTPALALDEGEMRRILDVNLGGTLRCTSVFGQAMAARGRGRIINISSASGITGGALASVYAATKAGMIAATRSAARAGAGRGGSVFAVAPGYCDTPMLSPRRALVERFVLPRIPAGRIARPEEVAEVVAFLATRPVEYMTGGVLTMDGGYSAG
jgi:NAD(P)-dependent dehydrogenase (short-subunit alcohol dehydrogenase family)